jgi:hypothetical protein
MSPHVKRGDGMQHTRMQLMAQRRRLTTAEKGYGREHRRLREQVRRIVDGGAAVCWRCGLFIDVGTPWDLGHADVPGAKQRGLYRGPEHRDCSRTAGGWKRQGLTGMPPPARRRAQPAAKALKFFETGRR